MSTSAQHVTGLRSAPQATFGAVLFVAWAIESFFWVYATIHSVANGEITPLITAVAALALLVLLFGMEGLEVAVIDRWRTMYPERTTSDLAAWLAARQLFVALIVTTATLLAHRDAIIIPGSGSEVTSGIVLGIFDLTWTGFTVLWFAQIFPKHLAATNPDRYLEHLRRTLFPVVEAVRQVGVSQPGEWVAAGVERRLEWPLPHVEGIEEGPVPREESLAAIWRELIPERAPSERAPTGSSAHPS
jgi:Mg2+/Co2+ transporter CorB